MEKRAYDLSPGDIVRFVNKGDRTVAEVKEGSVRSQYTNRPYNVIWVRWEGQTDFAWKIGRSSWVSLANNSCEDCKASIPSTDRYCGPCATMQDWGEGI